MNRSSVGRRIRRIIRRLSDPTYLLCLESRSGFSDLEMAVIRDHFIRGLSLRRIARDHKLCYYRARVIVEKARAFARERMQPRRGTPSHAGTSKRRRYEIAAVRSRIFVGRSGWQRQEQEGRHMTTYTVSKQFVWQGPLSERAVRVCRMFGLTIDRLTDRRRLPRVPGRDPARGHRVHHRALGRRQERPAARAPALRAAVGRGQSGGHRAARRQDRDRLFRATTSSRALQTLSTVGLGDVFSILNRPSRLSDGQKYRFRLARALDLGQAVRLRRRVLQRVGPDHRRHRRVQRPPVRQAGRRSRSSWPPAATTS